MMRQERFHYRRLLPETEDERDIIRREMARLIMPSRRIIRLADVLDPVSEISESVSQLIDALERPSPSMAVDLGNLAAWIIDQGISELGHLSPLRNGEFVTPEPDPQFHGQQLKRQTLWFEM